MSVNGLHYWLVIKRCSFMFYFSSHIRMLKLVHCSGRDGAQDPGFCLINIQAMGSLWIIMIYYMNHLIGWLRPYLSLLVGPYLLDGCVHTLDPCFCTLYYRWLHPYHISCIRDISCIWVRKFSDGSVFSWVHSHKAFHASLSLGPHALGGICYTTFCHHPCNPSSYILEGISHDL